MTTILILIGIYLVSVVGAYKAIQKLSHNKDFQDFFVTICPIANTIIVFGALFIYTGSIDWNKFFNKF